MRKEMMIVAEPRTSRGKNEAHRTRAAGRIPAVLYGAGKGATAVSVDPKEIDKILYSNTGHNTIFDLKVDGQETSPVMIVDWQHDPQARQAYEFLVSQEEEHYRLLQNTHDYLTQNQTWWDSEELPFFTG